MRGNNSSDTMESLSVDHQSEDESFVVLEEERSVSLVPWRRETGVQTEELLLLSDYESFVANQYVLRDKLENALKSATENRQKLVLQLEKKNEQLRNMSRIIENYVNLTESQQRAKRFHGKLNVFLTLCFVILTLWTLT